MIRMSTTTSIRTRALAGLGAVAMLMGAGLVPSVQTPARGTEQVTSEAVLVSGNAFFRHDYAEVGARPNASFGSVADAPTGWHPGGRPNLGFVADRDKDGWGVGIDDGDFILPGAEYEGWGLEVIRGASVSTAYNTDTSTDIAGQFLAVEDTEVARVVWESDAPFADVDVRKVYSLPSDGGQTLQMEVELTNNGTDPAVIVYKRGVDADNCHDRYLSGDASEVTQLCDITIEPAETDSWTTFVDQFTTLNRVESQRARGDVLSAVSSSQTDGSYLVLWSADPDSVVFAGAADPEGDYPNLGEFCREPNDLLGLYDAMGSTADFTNANPFDHTESAGGNCGYYFNAPAPAVRTDELIYLLIRKEIPAGETVRFSLAYSLSSADFDVAVLAAERLDRPRPVVVASPPFVLAPDGSTPFSPTGTGVWQQADGTQVPLVPSSPESRQLRYETDGLTVTFTGAPGTSTANGLVADANGEIVCEVCVALAAGQVIEAWMFPEPRLVAAWRVEDLPCQRFSIPVVAPLDGGGPVSAGAHTLQLALPTASGMQAVNVGVTVGGPVPASVPAGEGSVPSGAGLLVLLGAAGALLAGRRLVTAS